MEITLKAIALGALLASPLATLAQPSQPSQPLTREQVRADLVQYENAGYNPTDWLHYPQNAQMARARIDANRDYGGSTPETSQAGEPHASPD